jgi:hypothetical protein
MDHPIIIDRKGKTKYATRAARALRAAMIEMDSWSLQSTNYIMTQADFDDIVKWGKE